MESTMAAFAISLIVLTFGVGVLGWELVKIIRDWIKSPS